jgi:hypothetical protein
VADQIVQANPLLVGTELEVSVEATADVPEGVMVEAIGLSRPIVRTDEIVHQDDPNDFCTARWAEGVEIDNGGLIAATTTSAVAELDIDLFLLRDGGDGVFDCIDDFLITASTSPIADESVSLARPPDGLYWIIVHGWSVPGGEAVFDINIDAIDGHDLAVASLPAGPLTANEPITFELQATVAYEPDTVWKGLLFIGPSDAPGALQVPVTITVPEAPAGELAADLSVAPDGLVTGDTATATLRVRNDGDSAEVLVAAIDVPAGLVVVPGSVQVPEGEAFFDLLNGRISWSVVLEAQEEMRLTFDVRASSLTGMVEIEATLDGLMRGTVDHLSAPIWINVEPPPKLIFVPVAGG